jgi:ABC-type multidrug transport system fused ATPase/permease subunit
MSLNFSYGVGHELAAKMYGRTLERPYSFHALINSSEIVGAVNKVQELVGGYVIPTINGAIALILAVSIGLTLLLIDPVVAIGAATAFGLSYALIASLVRGRLSHAGQLVSRTHSSRIQAIQEGLGAIRDVILDRSQKVFEARFAVSDSQFATAQTASNFLSSAPRLLIEAVGMLVLIGFTLAFSSSETGLTGLLPVLGALAVGAQKLLPLIQQIYLGWTALVSRQAVLLDVLELIEFQPIQTEQTPLHFKHLLSLRNVSFSFPGPSHTATLHHIDLQIHKGEKIGIVGKTGSGKSTLLDVVMGLLPPSDGSVFVDEQRLTAANTKNWQKYLAHVPQSIYMIDASVAENIALGLPIAQIDMARVVRAAEVAQIHAHVMTLPNGYRAEVGERGIRLSGGQRQRIGIARALYKGADFLVLDEATSALDDETESNVIRGIEALPGVTVVMIAHRLSTLANCDRIVELRNGRLFDVSPEDIGANAFSNGTARPVLG